MIKPKVTEEKFQVLRTLVALTHLDGEVCLKEQEFLKKIILSLHLDSEQRKTLVSDLKFPQDPVSLFSQIDAPKSRAWLISLALTLVHADGEFCESEREALSRINEAHVDGLNIEAIIGDAAAQGIIVSGGKKELLNRLSKLTLDINRRAQTKLEKERLKAS